MKAAAEPLPRSESRATGTSGARSLLSVGTTAVLIGIGLSAAGSPELGSWLTVGSLLLLLVGLHRFGRSGPDLPPRTADEPKRRRKKKRRSAPRPAEAEAEPGPSARGDVQAGKPDDDSPGG